MFDEKNHDRNDALGQRLQKIGGQMNPSPELKKAAKTGVPLRAGGIKYTAGTHIRKFTKAVLLYAACIMLFLGAILLIPRWFGGNEPTPGGSVDPIVTIEPTECEHIWTTTENTPTCTEGCTQYSTCQLCGLCVTQWLNALGHNYMDGVCTRCGEAERPAPADCEHLQSPATCPYCNCDGHEFAGNTCTKCGLVCQHDYVGDACDATCTRCGKRLGHDYETVTSDEHICTEGTLTTTACNRCGYGYTETTPAKGHSYKDGVCTVCGEAEKVISVTDPNVTAGSISLLPGQMYLTSPDLSGDDFYWMDPTTTPLFYNVYTYFEGYTITDIRLPVYRAEKGSAFTVRVMRTNNGINNEEIATYKLTADRALSREWVLFSGLSIEVPEGCTLVFGWMSDTLELAQPVSGYIPGYSYCNDYRGSCGTVPLIMDVYGKKN